MRVLYNDRGGLLAGAVSQVDSGAAGSRTNVSKIYSRCERCRRFRSLAVVLVYVPPGTMKTCRLCAECETVVGKIGRGLKREIVK